MENTISKVGGHSTSTSRERRVTSIMQIKLAILFRLCNFAVRQDHTILIFSNENLPFLPIIYTLCEKLVLLRCTQHLSQHLIKIVVKLGEFSSFLNRKLL